MERSIKTWVGVGAWDSIAWNKYVLDFRNGFVHSSRFR